MFECEFFLTLIITEANANANAKKKKKNRNISNKKKSAHDCLHVLQSLHMRM